MNERIIIHAIWAGAIMYCVAIFCLMINSMYRPAETAEAAAAKLLALFGPLMALISAILFRRNGPSAPQPPRQDRGANAQEK